MADKLLLHAKPFVCSCGNDLFTPVEEDTQFECTTCKLRVWQKDGKQVDKTVLDA